MILVVGATGMLGNEICLLLAKQGQSVRALVRSTSAVERTETLKAVGVELVVGARLDPQFGPLIVVGLGGVLVELLADTAVELAPVDAGQARRMLESLKGYKLLTGYRGSAPVDLDRLAGIVSAVSRLAADLADTIAEIDVNPVICSAERIVAVDGLIVRWE